MVRARTITNSRALAAAVLAAASAGCGASSAAHTTKSDPCAVVRGQASQYDRTIASASPYAAAEPSAQQTEHFAYLSYAYLIVQNPSCFTPGDRANAQAFIDWSKRQQGG